MVPSPLNVYIVNQECYYLLDHINSWALLLHMPPEVRGPMYWCHTSFPYQETLICMVEPQISMCLKNYISYQNLNPTVSQCGAPYHVVPLGYSPLSPLDNPALISVQHPTPNT